MSVSVPLASVSPPTFVESIVLAIVTDVAGAALIAIGDVLFLKRVARSTPADAAEYWIVPPVNVIGPVLPSAVADWSERMPPATVVVPV